MKKFLLSIVTLAILGVGLSANVSQVQADSSSVDAVIGPQYQAANVQDFFTVIKFKSGQYSAPSDITYKELRFNSGFQQTGYTPVSTTTTSIGIAYRRQYTYRTW